MLTPDPPDASVQASLVVLGSSLALFSTTGVVNAYGFFQSYYTDVLLTNSSSTSIAFIGALQIALVYGGGPITGRVFDVHGLKLLFPLGSLFVVLSFMLISICQPNQPYQFFLAQGVLSGLGNSMIFTPSVAVMSHWFKRRRALAIGVTIAGSSLGGVVYPIMLQELKVKVGFPWAVRIAGFITLACLLVSNATVKTRLPPQNHKSLKLTHLVDFAGFRDLRYVLATVSATLFFFALFIPLFYIEEYARYNGVSPRLASYLLALINGCGIPARIIPGFLGDHYGVLQVLIPSTVLSGAFVLAIWLPARAEGAIVAFSALYGLCSSSFVSMLPAYIATITPVKKFGARLGTIYFCVAIACLAGTPTAGAFVPTFTQANFNHLIIFTGVMLLASAVFMAVALKVPAPPPITGDPQEDSEDAPSDVETSASGGFSPDHRLQTHHDLDEKGPDEVRMEVEIEELEVEKLSEPSPPASSSHYQYHQ